MVRDKRMKTNNDVIDAMHQVFENTSQHNEWWRERNLVLENTSQHNEWGKDPVVG